jgi:hypothetical protein
MRNHLEKLAFIDETSLKTNMIKTSGWGPVWALEHPNLHRRPAV